MNHDEAKFLLRAHRPGTADDRDPVFAEALAFASRDPGLRAWLESQHAFDEAVVRKLAEIQPEAGSLESILAGARAQRRSRRRARTFVWLAAAAAFAVLLSVAGVLHRRTIPDDGDSFHQIALTDMNGALWRHQSGAGGMETLGSELLTGDIREKAARLIELSALRADGCRVVSVAGRDVFEFCFGPRHEYHLYVAKRDDFPKEAGDGDLRIENAGRYALASWADERHVYSLVSYAGAAALKQVL
jgi:hypothetical protein